MEVSEKEYGHPRNVYSSLIFFLSCYLAVISRYVYLWVKCAEQLHWQAWLLMQLQNQMGDVIVVETLF